MGAARTAARPVAVGLWCGIRRGAAHDLARAWRGDTRDGADAARGLIRRLVLGLDLLDQRLPLRHLVLDLGAELRGRGLHRLGAGLAHGLLHVRIVGHGDQDLGKLADDRLRRLGRRDDAVPGLGDEVRHDRLVHRRHIGEIRAALERGDGERARRARLDLRQGVGHVGEGQVDLAGDHRRGRGRAALERDVHHAGAGAGLEQRHRIMRQAADAARTVVELAGIGLGIGDEFGQRLHRQLLAGEEDVRRAIDQRDRREIAHRVVGHVLVGRRDDTVRAGIAHDQRVAVGR